MSKVKAAHFNVVVTPAGVQWLAPADQPLLQSAREAGIGLPASCRNGSCRTCMCRALEGQVAYRIEWPGLLAEEKAEGWILPCVAHPVSDLTLEQPLAFDLFGG